MSQSGSQLASRIQNGLTLTLRVHPNRSHFPNPTKNEVSIKAFGCCAFGFRPFPSISFWGIFLTRQTAQTLKHQKNNYSTANRQTVVYRALLPHQFRCRLAISWRNNFELHISGHGWAEDTPCPLVAGFRLKFRGGVLYMETGASTAAVLFILCAGWNSLPFCWWRVSVLC